MCKSLLVSEFTDGITADSTYANIGAMSAPLKFIAIASNNQMKITPAGIVKIDYG